MALQKLEGKKSTDLGGPCPELGTSATVLSDEL